MFPGEIGAVEMSENPEKAGKRGVAELIKDLVAEVRKLGSNQRKSDEAVKRLEQRANADRRYREELENVLNVMSAVLFDLTATQADQAGVAAANESSDVIAATLSGQRDTWLSHLMVLDPQRYAAITGQDVEEIKIAAKAILQARAEQAGS